MVRRGGKGLKKGLRWRAVNEVKIFFWLDAWLEDRTLCKLVVIQLGEEMKKLKVREL